MDGPAGADGAATFVCMVEAEVDASDRLETLDSATDCVAHCSSSMSISVMSLSSYIESSVSVHCSAGGCARPPLLPRSAAASRVRESMDVEHDNASVVVDRRSVTEVKSEAASVATEEPDVRRERFPASLTATPSLRRQKSPATSGVSDSALAAASKIFAAFRTAGSMDTGRDDGATTGGLATTSTSTSVALPPQKTGASRAGGSDEGRATGGDWLAVEEWGRALGAVGSVFAVGESDCGGVALGDS